MKKAKVGLILLLTLGLSEDTRQAAQARAPEPKADSPKTASDKAAPTDLYGDPLPSGAIARLGTVRFRHGGLLTDALISPDGNTVFSAGEHSVEWWDARNGRQLRRIELSNPNDRGPGIDLSPDGKLLALHFNVGGKMRFWDVASGEEAHPFGDAPPAAGRIAFSPRGDLLAQLEFPNRRTISIWDIRKGKKIRTIEGGERSSSVVRSFAFSPSGKLLAFPRATGVRVWDLVADKERYQLDPGAKTPIGCVAFSPDGKLLAAACNPFERGPDHAIHLWDMATGKEVGALQGHEGDIDLLAMSPIGNLLVSASTDQTIRFWDLEKRKEVGRIPGPTRAFGLSFSADGSVLVSSDRYGVLRLWDARKRQKMAIPSAGVNSVQWVSFAPDGQTLISTVQGQIGIAEPLTGRPIHIFNCPYLLSYHPSLSPDGKRLATASDRTQGQALLWDVASGKLVRRLGESGQPSVTNVAFSPDGRRVASSSYAEDIIRVWDAANGKELLQLKGQSQCRCLAFAPDGATLAASSGWANREIEVRLWKLATGGEIWRKSSRPWLAFDLSFSPDGRTLALVGSMPGQSNTIGEIHLWETATGKELKRFESQSFTVLRVAFSSDGRMLATGSNDDGAVRLWEVATGRERQCFRGHQNSITALSFSLDGRLLASASIDSTALVWDLTGRFRDGHFQPRHLSADELDRCWNDLAHNDAARAYRSIVVLWGSPKEAVAFLKDHLSPMTAADSERAAPLLAALDSDQFAERDKAMAELVKLGLAVEPALRAALDAKPSLEKRQRIEAILEKQDAGPRLRLLRAFETLERIATPEARQLLEAMSKGSAELWPTQEAEASLARLSARPTLRP